MNVNVKKITKSLSVVKKKKYTLSEGTLMAEAPHKHYVACWDLLLN